MNTEMNHHQSALIKPVSLGVSVILFLIPALYFIGITRVLIPFLNSTHAIHPALSWFTGGLLIFPLLFMAAWRLARRDGFHTFSNIRTRLRIKPLSRRDGFYVLVSTLAVFLLTGLIMAVSRWLALRYGIAEIETAPAFLKFEPLTGHDRWLLLIWLVMFFFNIVGEEMLWRGYILPRQELAFGTKSWMLNSLLWILFHLCFGPDLIILMLPILIILPFAVYKTGNTTVGILIHALLNGPMFVLVALGVVH